jgi:glutathione S-transferase
LASQQIVEFSGVPGSPYTRKMLALLRYRRIPYRLYPSHKFLLTEQSQRNKPRAEPKVPLLPTFYFKDESGTEIALCDSTPIIRKLELEHVGREVVPESALGFINYLIEDYGDEWLTKAMFHYRWHYGPDSEKAAQMLPRWNNTNADESALQAKAVSVAELQISRLSYVGSNPQTQSTIENSFKRLVGILDNLLKIKPFILGDRPSSADFALYGQLTALALFDPTPQAIILKLSPRLYAWTETMEDLSGYEPLETDWLDLTTSSDHIHELLTEIGRVYTPYLLANAAAVNKQQPEFQCEIDGTTWTQGTFVYQAKCLQWIRDEFAALDTQNQSLVMSLAKTCGFSDLVESR